MNFASLISRSLSFLGLSFAFLGGAVALLLLLVGIIDPYGVSPLDLRIDGLNAIKTKRIDIDRQIKPYEVWRYQPYTLFLGTSRIHQGFDPAVLDGTEFAPAYNAAVPAATIRENAEFLRLYLKTDANLKTVIFELFPYALMQDQRTTPALSKWETVRVAQQLWLSATALYGAFATIIENQHTKDSGPQIHPRGYWIQPSGQIRGHYFIPESYADFVLHVHKTVKILDVDESAIAELIDLQAQCDARGVRLIFVVTPSYPWDDYRLAALGFSDFIPSIYRRIANLREVYTFGQFNAITNEPPSDGMRYWYDVFHFSREFGAAMLNALASRPPAIDNFMIRLNNETVQHAVKAREESFLQWKAANIEFVQLFDEARRLSAQDKQESGQIASSDRLIVGDRTYRIVPGRGKVELSRVENGRTIIAGWMAGPNEDKHRTRYVLVTQGRNVIASWFPTTGRTDIERSLGSQYRPAGFSFSLPGNFDRRKGLIRVFGLTDSNLAFEAESNLDLVDRPLLLTAGAGKE